MFDKIGKWLSAETMEFKLLLTALLFAIPYFASSLVFDFLHNSSIIFFVLDGTLFGLCLSFIPLARNKKFRLFIIYTFCAMIIAGAVIYWGITQGIYGGGRYIFSLVSVLVILLSKGIMKVVFAVVLASVAALLISGMLEVTGSVTYPDLLFDFILNVVVLTIILVVFKRALDGEESDLQSQNRRISELNEELDKKTKELEFYNLDIELMKKNLEKTVIKRTEELEKENQLDLEYAFINAHLVRAPVANIIGLTEELKENHPRMKELQQNVQELDGIVRKIGGVLAQG